MKQLLFIFIFGQSLLFSQTKNIISFKTEWEEFALNNDTDSLIEDKTEKSIFFINFLFNKKKDTIFINKSEILSEIDNENKFINRLTVDVSNNKANLLVWNKNYTDTIVLRFHHQERAVQINNDLYSLTNEYYSFFKKKVLKDRNITEIIDFLDDELGNYFLPAEIFLIGSKSKYRKKFRIKNATIKTIKVDSDGLDSWKISFLYDKKGILEIQKKGIDDEISYLKRRKYIDFEKIIFEIEENTVKRNTITQQEIYLSNKKQKIKQQNIQYGLNITTFVKNESKKILNDKQ
ncbi:hypothetical protein [Capnocytophaga stomatis]|uniref:Uncharacterized protein n=1 Tax=Capnocytophaga stomatis TaxID=1848904 RepID=A0A250FZ17_9FLAO|nr:hypothetical protein [Capnocytophaga stomatis]ATA90303.1 hypothetical protein CGC58_11525 [Capnocytophaga stomatis]GIJ94237.1 hypothetical protein CAPN002_14550 [Capnocytophaga stomatis]GIM50963.1 hypothetical protein CAPN003_24150 [Capnocytophaga stomatis]